MTPPPAKSPEPASAASLHLLAEALPHLVWLARPDGHVEHFNPSWYAYTGSTPEQSAGMRWFSFVHPDDLERVRRTWVEVNATGRLYEVELRYRGADGGYRWFLARAVPEPGPDGRPARWVGASTDITAHKEGEARLRESEARFRNMADNAPVMLWVTDTSGACVYINQVWCDATGQTLEEALGLGWVDAVHPEDRARAKDAFLDAHARRAPFQSEYRLRGRDGRYRWSLDSARPRVGPGGEFLGYIGSVVDISARKQVEERLRLLAETSRLLGEHLEAPEPVLQRVARLAADTLATYCIVDLVDEEGGGVRRVALAHRTPAGATLLEAVRAAPPRAGTDSDGARALADGTARLIEDFDAQARDRVAVSPAHRRALDALDAHSVLLLPVRARGRVLGLVTLAAAAPQPRFGPGDLALGEELAQRTAAALENARLYREAQAAVRLRDEFLSVASHELKTPLTPLQLRLQSLKRDAQGTRPEHVPRTRLVKGLETAEAQVRKLGALVNALLDVSRLTQGRLALQPEPGVDLAALVRECAAALGQEAERARCTLQVHAPAPVVGSFDRLRLEQVVHNLLSNALKYGAGQPVHVEVAAAGGEARLTVRDAGIGIAADALPRLFGKFERAVSERHYGGLGLGLYITRQILEAMGGRVRVQSVLGQGAVFEVALPL